MLPVALPAVVLGWMAHRVYPFIEDDSLISLRYAERLLAGRGLTWTPGEAVEGYSNLLWVLLAAGLGALGMDLVTAVRVLGLFSTLLVFAAIALRHPPARSPGGALPALAGATLVAASGPAALWSIAGLETPLFAALVALAFWLLAPRLDNPAPGRRGILLAALPLALLCPTRPDAPLFVAFFTLALFLAWLRAFGFRAALSSALSLAAPPLVLLLSQLGFRLAYYGELVPNTAHIKAQVSLERFPEGLAYLEAGFSHLWPLGALALPGAVLGLLDRRRRTSTLLLLGSALAWLGYVALIGGDHFPGHRHLLVVVVLLAFLVALGVERLFELGRALSVVGVGAAMALGVPFVLLQYEDPDFRMGAHARWQWDGAVIGKLFGEGFRKEKPLYAVTAAGCLPFFSKLPALDLLGLNDRHIAKKAALPGQPLAHDHGDGAYALARKPDLITFGLPVGGRPVTVSGAQMEADPRFRKEYQAVRFEGVVPYRVVSRSYVRVRGRVGIRTKGPSIRYPAYLLRGAVLGRRTAEGRMGARLYSGRRAQTRTLSLRPGTYRLRVEPENPYVGLDVRQESGEADLYSGETPTLRVRRKTRLRVGASTPVHTTFDALQIEPTTASDLRDERWVRLDPAVWTEARPARTLPELQATTLATFDAGLDGWLPRGDAHLWPAAGPHVGQSQIPGNQGGFINTFDGVHGDTGTGALESPEFVVPPRAFLSLRLGGGRAMDFHTQVGVRLTEAGSPVEFLSGIREETLEHRRVDLQSYAGRRLKLEIFDDSTLGWGHTVVDEVRLEHEPAEVEDAPAAFEPVPAP